MASLVILDGERQGETIPLVHGPNLLGRAEGCGLRCDHPTVSGHHCELFVSEFGVRVRDLDSSNGTSVDGVPVREAELRDGQVLTIGELRFRAVVPPVRIAIPELAPPEESGPAVTADGLPACETHRSIPATHFCTHCERTFCPDCIRPIRIAGGRTRLLCPRCSYPCQSLEARAEGQDAHSMKNRIVKAFRVAFDFRRPPRRPR